MRKLGLTVRHVGVGIALAVSLAMACCSRTGSQEPVPRSAAAGPSPSAPAAAAAPGAEGSSAATQPAQASPTRVYDDKTTAIETTVGDKFAVYLPANITTPYKWVVAPSDASPIVVLADRHYQDKSPEGCQACVGYPGTDIMNFEAKAAGTTTGKLRYAPLRSKAEPSERELSIQVTVKKKQ